MSSFSVSRTYSETQPDEEDSEHGHVFQNKIMDLEEVARELCDCNSLSSSPVYSSKDLRGTEWACVEAFIVDFATGVSREEAVHIRKADGEPLSPWLLFRIFKIAHLTDTLPE